MKVHFTEGAWNSLDKTTDFYLSELDIPAFMVNKIVRELLKKVQLLVQNPLFGAEGTILISFG